MCSFCIKKDHLHKQFVLSWISVHNVWCRQRRRL